MGKCIIFCAADFQTLLEPIGPEDHVIAADKPVIVAALQEKTAQGLYPDGLWK